jgi:hypothetical protein
MTNLECAIAALEAHREARLWTDEAVAADLMVRLGLDPAAEVSPAAPAADAAVVDEPTTRRGSRDRS